VIDELDLVVLKRDLPTERLAAGDVGTVVLVHQQGQAMRSSLQLFLAKPLPS
jgi:Domain of unknown function (DUF4926)